MKITRIISTAIAKRIGYTVIGTGCVKRHYTHSYGEAMAWAKCYRLSGATIHLSGFFSVMPLVNIAPTVDRVIGKSA
jgi:hypothetical protein